VKRLLTLAVAVCFLMSASCATAKNPVVEIDTSVGKIKVELDEEKAPITVKNFLSYVDDKFYDNTVFHRVIGKFMIQGGGFMPGVGAAETPKEFTKLEKETKKPPIKLEVKTGLSNTRGTIAMARTSDPDSATAQFFINVVDNSKKLDDPIKTPRGDVRGYAVFGKVTDGMDVVDKIKSVKTKAIIPDELEDIPVEDVIIKSIRRVDK
jgi:cyclophilin family peptidyl-prolyl cis-trans isomerase